jgi:hypothetical protein
MQKTQHPEPDIDQPGGKQGIPVPVFDIDVFQRHGPEKGYIQMTHAHAGIQLTGKIFFGFGPGKILDPGRLDKEEDQEQDDEYRQQSLPKDTR